MDNPVVANVFGTLGAVLWSLQVIQMCTAASSWTTNINVSQATAADLDELAPT